MNKRDWRDNPPGHAWSIDYSDAHGTVMSCECGWATEQKHWEDPYLTLIPQYRDHVGLVERGVPHG